MILGYLVSKQTSANLYKKKSSKKSYLKWHTQNVYIFIHLNTTILIDKHWEKARLLKF